MAVLLMIWAAILVAGDTPIGRMLRTAFVERPAALFDRIGRGHVALAVLFLMIGIAAVWAGGADALRMAGMAAPDLAVWATTFEVATYLDVAITVVLVASTLRLKTLWIGLRAWVARAPRARARRRRGSRPRASANDDAEERHRYAA